MSTNISGTLPGGAPAPPAKLHGVQFYESEEFLCTPVADFLAAGIAAHEPLVIVATAAHCKAFFETLNRRGIAVDESATRVADAQETLSRFMIDSLPDPALFKSVVEGLLRDAVGQSGQQARVYGEMVDLLWRAGNVAGAIRLEELWNELAGENQFSLLCAYPMANFVKSAHQEGFDAICRQHHRVFPSESHKTDPNDPGNLAEISRLQQKALALETEIEHRKELEKALREALSARRLAEERVRRSERELKDLVNNASIGIHWVGADGNILWANTSELEMLGYEPSQYIGHHISEFHADRSTIDDILRRLSANEEIHDYQARLVARDGTVRIVSINSNVLFEEGQFIHTRCFTRDITERKRQEASSAFLLDATTILNANLDFEDRLREVVALAVPTIGCWVGIDLSGCPDRFISGTAGNEPPAETRAAVLQSGRAEMAADRSWMVVPVRVADRILGTVASVCLPGARYSDADRWLLVEFGCRAAIAVENSRHYRLAQEANRAKDQFLATLSHELRTPLTAILGWARMLTLGGLDNDTMQTAFDTIERSAKSQAAIIDDLLDLSRVVTGKLTLNHDLVDISSVIANAVQTFNLAAAAKNIRVDVDTPLAPARLVVNGDATRLQQIVWNLIANAVKFSEPGGVIQVSLRSDGDEVLITVRDSGRGIAPDFISHVFEPFRQGDGAPTRAYNGLGLGLAIVKYLTEAHGGTVRAMSEGIGQGATFVVNLPLANRRTVRNSTQPESLLADLSNTSVMVVDDDQDTRELLMAALHRCGADVLAAESVGRACEILKTRRPTIVVSDIAMPGEDGYAMLRIIRAGENGRRTPVIALTASGDPAVEERIRQSGFDGYVAKPVDPLHLARVLSTVIQAA